MLSNCSGFRLVLLSCIMGPTPENCLSTFAEVAGIEKIQRARRDKRGKINIDHC